jgi:hypothetical protein
MKGLNKYNKNIIYAQTLRLGNLVISEDDHVIEVSEISWHNEGEYSIHWIAGTAISRDYICNYPIDTYRYVPITEEWLLKCKQIDFRYDKYFFTAGMVIYDIDINHKRYQAKDITIIAEYDNVQLAIAGINYMHELQNLYYALTKDELVFA